MGTRKFIKLATLAVLLLISVFAVSTPAFAGGSYGGDGTVVYGIEFTENDGSTSIIRSNYVDDAGRTWEQCKINIKTDTENANNKVTRYFAGAHYDVLIEEKLADGTITFYNTDGTLAEKNKYTVHYLVNSTEIDAETYEYNETFTVAAPTKYKTTDTTDYTYSISTEWKSNSVFTEYNIYNTVVSGTTCRMPYEDIYLYATETKTLNVSKAFSDVSKTAWYYEYVTRAVNQGIMNGYGNSNIFGPDDTVPQNVGKTY